MTYRPIQTYLKWLLECIEKLESYTNGIGYNEFLVNPEKQDACFMVCIVLGETAVQIKKYHPTFDIIPDQEMIGLRNFIAHQYHKIDTKIVRDVIKIQLPKIKITIKYYLDH